MAMHFTLTQFIQEWACWGQQMALPLASIAAVMVETPKADVTGISAALVGLARLGAGFLGGVLTLFLVIQGYQYMSTDETTRGVALKRGIAALLGGTILVVIAATLAPQLLITIVTGR
jgi:hypothetical protein